MPEKNEKAEVIIGQVTQQFFLFIVDICQFNWQVFNAGTFFKFGICWYDVGNVINTR